jgi:hypothetical protein
MCQVLAITGRLVVRLCAVRGRSSAVPTRAGAWMSIAMNMVPSPELVSHPVPPQPVCGVVAKPTRSIGRVMRAVRSRPARACCGGCRRCYAETDGPLPGRWFSTTVGRFLEYESLQRADDRHAPPSAGHGRSARAPSEKIAVGESSGSLPPSWRTLGARTRRLPQK